MNNVHLYPNPRPGVPLAARRDLSTPAPQVGYGILPEGDAVTGREHHIMAVEPVASVSESPSCILLVEDNDDLRTVMQMLLEMQGYTVCACPDAEEAQRALETSPGFDLLLTDLQMPGKSGAWLASSATQRTPGLPVLIVSGMNPSQTELTAFRGLGWRFLNKPFDTPHLLMQIRNLLETGPQKSSAPKVNRTPAADSTDAGSSSAVEFAATQRVTSVAGSGNVRFSSLSEDALLRGTHELLLRHSDYATVSQDSFAEMLKSASQASIW